MTEKDKKTQGWCQNSRRWLVFMDLHGQYPSTCPYEGDCDQCSYFEERPPTKYLLNKEKSIKEVFKDV